MVVVQQYRHDLKTASGSRAHQGTGALQARFIERLVAPKARQNLLFADINHAAAQKRKCPTNQANYSAAL